MNQITIIQMQTINLNHVNNNFYGVMKFINGVVVAMPTQESGILLAD